MHMINHSASPRRITDIIGRGFLILSICALLTGLLSTSQISASGPPAEAEPIVARYEFPEPIVSKAGDYHTVHVEGLLNLNQPGLPRLPIKTVKLLIPFDREMAQVRVFPGRKVTLKGSYLVEPGQRPTPLSHAGPGFPKPPVPEVYGSAQPFPGELHSPVAFQNRRGYRLLVFTLYPAEYLPEPGTLSYYESLTVQVDLQPASWEPGAVRMLRRRPGQWAADRADVRALVDNPDAVTAYPAATHLERVRQEEPVSILAPGTPYDYVIITDEALMAAPGPYNFQALKADKDARGVSTLITTTEWISVTYSGWRPDGGVDLQTKIRDFVIDAYATWGTEYVLLGGDGDGAAVGGESGDTIIPHRGFYNDGGDGYPGDSDIPADMYYACLDGTFDYDADGVYAEPTDGPDGGEVDLFAEVYVGRAPVDSCAELSNFVRKTLAYQSDDDNYLRQVWMVGQYLGFLDETHVWGGDAKDDIVHGFNPAGYTATITATVGFENSSHADFFDTHTLYDRDRSPDRWSKSEMIAVINSPAHIINHLGHTSVTSAMRLSIADVTGTLTNTHYFIGYSQGCHAGAFDNRTIYGYYHSSDCIGEHFTNGEHGAVAFVANSRSGWTDEGGNPHIGASHYYDRQFWDAVLAEGIFQVGRANQDSKEDTYGVLGSGGFTWVMRWCYYDLNVLGDPALAVKIVDLEINKFGDPDPVPAGGVLTYTLTVSNTGTANATGIVVTDAIPANTAFAAATGVYSDGVVTWSDLSLGPGARLQVALVVTVGQVASGTLITNDAYGVWCTEVPTPTHGASVTTMVWGPNRFYLPLVVRE